MLLCTGLAVILGIWLSHSTEHRIRNSIVPVCVYVFVSPCRFLSNGSVSIVTCMDDY
jgi:hypothetical protein